MAQTATQQAPATRVSLTLTSGYTGEKLQIELGLELNACQREYVRRTGIALDPTDPEVLLDLVRPIAEGFGWDFWDLHSQDGTIWTSSEL